MPTASAVKVSRWQVGRNTVFALRVKPRRPGFLTLKRHLDAVVAAIHRRLLGPANRNTRNLADHKRGFRIYSRHRMRMIPAVRNRISSTLMKDGISWTAPKHWIRR
jgi:hypothetical protein